MNKKRCLFVCQCLFSCEAEGKMDQHIFETLASSMIFTISTFLAQDNDFPAF